MKFLKSMSLGLLPNTLALGQGPCDIYEAAKTPCVAAHSTVRALFSAYAGSLYEVKRHTDNATHMIGLLAPGGLADSAEQDTFCGNAFCSIVRIFDQSTQGNHLSTAPGGGHVHTPDRGVNATRHKISLNGHFVYGAFFEGGMVRLLLTFSAVPFSETVYKSKSTYTPYCWDFRTPKGLSKR